MCELDGKVAIVTGGATLIGQKVVEALRAAGAEVVVGDVNVADGQALADRLGDGVRFVETDVTDDAQLDRLVDTAVSTFGGVDLLVNMAAVYVDEGLETSRADWLTAFDVNVVSGAILAEKVSSHMEARGGGAVVNFSSISAKVAQPLFFVYSTTKGAIAELTRVEAIRLAPKGIRVNSVSPGWTWSNPIRDMSGDDRAFVDRIGGAFHMLRRIGDPEEVADAVVFLCSDRASFITGADLAVDGGYSALGPEQMGQPLTELLERMQARS